MGVSLNVTEWMKGYITIGATDVESGFMKGFDEETFFKHKLLIAIDDIDKMLADPAHTAKVDGAIVCNAFNAGKACRVTDGTFNMHIDPRNPDLKLMFYRLPFKTDAGKALTLLGQKMLVSDRAHEFEAFNDILRLNVRIYDGLVAGLDPVAESSAKANAAPPTPAIGMGVLYIEALDAFRSARSIRCPGASPSDATAAIETFGAFYMDRLWKVYGKTAPRPHSRPHPHPKS